MPGFRARVMWFAAMLIALTPSLGAQSRSQPGPVLPASVDRGPSDASIRAGVDSMRQYSTAERPDLAIAVGRRLLRRAPADPRLRAWYAASLDQSRRFDELWAFLRPCNAAPSNPWNLVECAYAFATRDPGWRMGLDSADVYLRAAVSKRPGDSDISLLVVRLLVRRAEFSTRSFAPVLAVLDSAVRRTNGDYDIRAWQAAVRYDAASVAPADTVAQRTALREFADLRREQPARIPAYHLAAERLKSVAAFDALALVEAASRLQPGSMELRGDYWTLLLRQPGVPDESRQAAVNSDIALWLPVMDSSTSALHLASKQLRALKRDSVARILEERLLARAPVSREADDVLWQRARAWNDATNRVGDSTSAHANADSARMRAGRVRALDALVFRHAFTSTLTRGFAAADLLDLIRADSSYPASKLLAVARLVHAARLLQVYRTHGIPAVALAERKVALDVAERWTREGMRNVWRELDDHRLLYPSIGERSAALARWQVVFLVASASVEIAAGRYALADSILDGALAITPGDADAQYQVGRLRLLRHQRDEAEMAFVRAFGGRDPLGINRSRRDLERLYVERQGSLVGWDAYLAGAGRREADARRTRLLASALPDAATPPPFALTDLDGRVVTSASLKGKIAIVNFWGTWCGPCVGEMSALQKLYDKYRSDSAVAIVTIAKDALADVRAWMTAKHYTIPTLIDEGYSTQAAIQAWPTTWVLDRDGAVRYRIRSTSDELVEEWSWIIDAMRGANRSRDLNPTPPGSPSAPASNSRP